MSGDHTGWGLGFEFSMPIGFRGATTQMQNIEHRISKARALLAQQEQEISYELAASFQQLDQSYQTAKTNYNRRRAAQFRVEAFEAELEFGRSTVDLVLRAQISLAQAEIAYYSSLVGYNQALNELRYRKGTLLMDNSVYLSESLWTEDAYDDALRRAWERSFAFESPNKVTEPSEFIDDCVDCLDTANGTFDYHNALPMEESLPPVVPGPMSLPEATPPAFDKRSALIPAEPEAGGLGGSYDEFVSEVIDEPGTSGIKTLDLIPESGSQGSIVPAPPIDGDSAPRLPASDPLGPAGLAPPMPSEGRSNVRSMFRSPSTDSSSGRQLMGGVSIQAAGNEFEEPIQTVDFSVESSSSVIGSAVSHIPTSDDDNVRDEMVPQTLGFSDSGSLLTSPRRTDEPSEQAEGKQPSSWGRFWRRK
jgi:hypothetical protein